MLQYEKLIIGMQLIHSYTGEFDIDVNSELQEITINIGMSRVPFSISDFLQDNGWTIGFTKSRGELGVSDQIWSFQLK